MPGKLQKNKPRLPFCWECTAMLYARTSHAVVICDGERREVHKSCADRMVRKGRAEYADAKAP